MTTPSSTSVADTVSNAEATPEKEQPYAALGLKPDEYDKIREILGDRVREAARRGCRVLWAGGHASIMTAGER